VVHDNGALADAAATALVVAGPERWHETASALGVRQAMVVDRHGRVQVTRALADRLYLEQATVRRTLVV
jgi:thiamine biosynthesis lipoprotein